MSSRSALSVCLWLVVGTAAIAHAQAPTITRHVDISALTAMRPEASGKVQALPVTSALESRERSPVEARPLLEAGDILELVRSLAPDDVDTGRLSLELGSGRVLILAGAPELVDRAVAAVAQAERIFLRPVTVNLYVIPSPRAVAESGVLDAAATTAVLAAAPPIRFAQARGVLGDTVELRAEESASLVVDCDVEVAQKSKIADPRVQELTTGLRGDVRVRATPSGLWVQADIALSHLISVDKLATEAVATGSIQRPRVRCQQVVGSAVVKPHGSLLLGASGAPGDPWFLIQLVADEASSEAVGGKSVALALGPITEAPRRLPRLTTGDAAQEGAETLDEEPEPLVSMDAVVAKLQRDLAIAGMADSSGIELRSHHLLVSPAAAAKVAMQALGPMAAAAERQVCVDVSIVGVGLAEMAQLTADASARAKAADRGTWRGRATALLGEEFRIVRGEESTYLRDFDVEIAAEAVVGDPVVEVLFAGFSLQGRVESRASGDPMLFGEYRYRDIVGPLGSFDGNAEHLGVIETPTVHRAGSRMALPVERGAWVLAGVAPAAQGAETQILLVRVR